MASLFTYETDPIRLRSPWPEVVNPVDTGRRGGESAEVPQVESIFNYNISKLESEPQEGPVEYKLHLMLRSRRRFLATSTVQKVSGSQSSKSRDQSQRYEDGSSGMSTSITAPSNISRQNRLHHLTTQLLWRLQQSCPHHAGSKSELNVPTLPELDIQQTLLQGPQKLVGGIEETLGALYEIGISDDGGLVGLLEEELDESLNILKAMAYSLGCQIEVLRKVNVGECSWNEASVDNLDASQHTERLFVAEVLK